MRTVLDTNSLPDMVCFDAYVEEQENILRLFVLINFFDLLYTHKGVGRVRLSVNKATALFCSYGCKLANLNHFDFSDNIVSSLHYGTTARHEHRDTFYRITPSGTQHRRRLVLEAIDNCSLSGANIQSTIGTVTSNQYRFKSNTEVEFENRSGQTSERTTSQFLNAYGISSSLTIDEFKASYQGESRVKGIILQHLVIEKIKQQISGKQYIAKKYLEDSFNKITDSIEENI